MLTKFFKNVYLDKKKICAVSYKKLSSNNYVIYLYLDSGEVFSSDFSISTEDEAERILIETVEAIN